MWAREGKSDGMGEVTGEGVMGAKGEVTMGKKLRV